MLYTLFQVKDKELKLRLTASATVQVERKIGRSPVSVLADIADDKFPRLDELLTILWGALLPLESGYTMEKVYKLYDEYVESGKGVAELSEIIVQVMTDSGFIPDDNAETHNEGAEEKNG